MTEFGIKKEQLLKPVRTLVYYDGSQLLVAVDPSGSQYLCLLAEQAGSGEHYFCSPISEARLRDFEQGGVELLDIYRKPEGGMTYIGEFVSGNCDTSLAVSRAEQVPEHWYPDEGFFLSAEV